MNKIYHLFILLVLLSTGLFAQDFNALKAPTQDHLLINGTNVNMIPPEGFLPSENFKGFQNPEDPYSMIMLMEIPGPFEEVSAGFSEENLTNQGMTLLSKKDIIINQKSGLFLELDQNASGVVFSKYILVYGQESTTLINGVFLKESADLKVQMKDAMLSTFIDNSIEVDPRAALNYTLDETVSDLQFNAVMGNSSLFNRDGKIPTESADNLSLIIDESYADAAIKDQKVFCIGRLREAPGDYSVITQKGIKDIEIAGMKGYELYGKSADNVKEEVYQAIIFKNDGGYFIFFASYLRGKGQTVDDVKKMIETFKLKANN